MGHEDVYLWVGLGWAAAEKDMSDFLNAEQQEWLDAYWRASNYLAVGQVLPQGQLGNFRGLMAFPAMYRHRFPNRSMKVANLA
jgi:hypothetical protein